MLTHIRQARRCQGSVREASIHFSLPPLYLSAAHPAKLTVDCSAPREVQDQLLHELRGRAAEWDGAPCLLLAIDWLQVRGAGAWLQRLLGSGGVALASGVGGWAWRFASSCLCLGA